MKEVWTKALGKTLGRLAKDNELTNTPGTSTIFVLDHDQIENIQSDRTIIYARIVVDV